MLLLTNSVPKAAAYRAKPDGPKACADLLVKVLAARTTPARVRLHFGPSRARRERRHRSPHDLPPVVCTSLGEISSKGLQASQAPQVRSERSANPSTGKPKVETTR